MVGTSRIHHPSWEGPVKQSILLLHPCRDQLIHRYVYVNFKLKHLNHDRTLHLLGCKGSNAFTYACKVSNSVSDPT
jgi:hypothetical protein